MNERKTYQRIRIAEYLKSVKTHPTAEIVYKKVSKEIPSITLATVYRNLNLLSEKGEILRFDVDKEYRYDAETNSHQHFICEDCGKVIDVFQKEISDYALKKIKNGLSPRSVSVIFHGRCNECSKPKIRSKEDLNLIKK